ncbi:ABC transporter ATP-binding protein [Rhodobacter sp. KR11]|uniref:ABC transporter ATP-binding protein n=1 Tax=Rhodobacter sp. KR11 TaxID=2974588 RepID=UPI002223B9B8|nr:ABC transporter ATP-binding protein [Rhodobacter sp. KR11]MCW1917286.1 ABC transporter ATP-binding protein [Rhodobacter sp. KR11]
MKSADIDVRNVTLRYGGKQPVLALDRLSLDVRPNEFAVIVGPSGCGKSSLLYLIAGLEDRTSGSIQVGGQEVTSPGADRGMVFQSYTLFPWLTVAQNVAYGPKRRGVDDPATVARYLHEVGLEAFADHYPAQLSGGMKQRVAIARALANDPAVLLMDEPFGALDSQTRHQMQRLLLRVWDHSKKTVLFVTHDIEEAILLADRVFVMSGRPGQIRRVLDVGFDRPRHEDLVLDPAFIALKREIMGLLRQDEVPAD